MFEDVYCKVFFGESQTGIIPLFFAQKSGRPKIFSPSLEANSSGGLESMGLTCPKLVLPSPNFESRLRYSPPTLHAMATKWDAPLP